MALPQLFYRDPSNVVDTINRQQEKLTKGCSACRSRGSYLGFEKYDCAAVPKKIPGKNGYCQAWRIIDLSKLNGGDQ